MSREGQLAKAHALKVLRDTVQQTAEKVLDESNRHIGVGDPRLDPDPAFALAEHGHIDYSPDGLEATIWYEGPYAHWQHEVLWARHPRGGGPKFLENALKAHAPDMPQILADETIQDDYLGRRCATTWSTRASSGSRGSPVTCRRCGWSRATVCRLPAKARTRSRSATTW
jgi:hypothetical protein